MRKNIVFGLLVIAISFLVFACVSDPPPKPEPVVPPPTTQPQVQTGLVLDGATNYTVVSGDTLSEIAARRYGGDNMFFFPLIRLANAAAVSDPDVIEVGTTLVIPDLQRNRNDAGARALMKQDMNSIAGQYERQGKPGSASRLRNLANSL
jgi:LysM repeat protein